MDSKENYLRAIHFDEPSYVPWYKEGVVKHIVYKNAVMPTDKGGTDLWGVFYQPDSTDTAYEHVCHPKVHPLENLDDLPNYRWPDPDDFTLEGEPTLFNDPLPTVDRGKHLVLGSHVYLLFERICPLMGMENFMVNLKLNPAVIRDLLTKITDYNIGIAERYLELGVDGCRVTEDLGSQRALLISPEDWRSFFKPELERFFKVYRDQKKIVYFHSCGHVMPIIEDLISIGVTVLNPIQASANDLGEIRRLSDFRMALDGGVDAHLMMTGNSEDVRVETIRLVRELAQHGGYVVGPDQHLPFPEDNVNSLIQTAKEIGRYPIVGA